MTKKKPARAIRRNPVKFNKNQLLALADAVAQAKEARASVALDGETQHCEACEAAPHRCGKRLITQAECDIIAIAKLGAAYRDLEFDKPTEQQVRDVAEAPMLRARVGDLESALREIEKGKGLFSLDHLTHAKNTIEDMKELARIALSTDGTKNKEDHRA